MAVTYCEITWQGREGDIDEYGHANAVVPYLVKTDNPDDGHIPVLASLPVVRFQQYADENGNSDIYAYLTKASAKNDQKDPCSWMVLATYSSEAYDPQKAVRNPLLRYPTIRWGSTKEKRALIKDMSDPAKLINNSAGEFFDPPLEVPRSIITLTVVRNELNSKLVDASGNFKPDVAQDYIDHINGGGSGGDTFYGFDPHIARCESITAENKYDALPFYSEVTYEFHFDTTNLDQNGNQIGWDKLEVDIGWRHFQPGSGSGAVPSVCVCVTGTKDNWDVPPTESATECQTFSGTTSDTWSLIQLDNGTGYGGAQVYLAGIYKNGKLVGEMDGNWQIVSLTSVTSGSCQTLSGDIIGPGAGLELVENVDNTGTPFAMARLLDGAGGLLDPSLYQTPSAYHYRGPFQVFAEADFGDLNLPGA